MVCGYLILISWDFYDFTSTFRWLRRCIEHSRQCLMATPNTLKLVINTPLCVVFSTLFSVCGNVFTDDIWCLTYYFNNSHPKYQNNSNMTPRLLTKNCNFLSHVHFHEIPRRNKSIPNTGADLGGGCRGCAPLPEMTYGFLKAGFH